jgi:hypothetical protein
MSWLWPIGGDFELQIFEQLICHLLPIKGHLDLQFFEQLISLSLEF